MTELISRVANYSHFLLGIEPHKLGHQYLIHGCCVADLVINVDEIHYWCGEGIPVNTLLSCTPMPGGNTCHKSLYSENQHR